MSQRAKPVRSILDRISLRQVTKEREKHHMLSFESNKTNLVTLSFIFNSSKSIILLDLPKTSFFILRFFKLLVSTAPVLYITFYDDDLLAFFLRSFNYLLKKRLETMFF
jgi:hypothetical protein